jgi:hypothetical protein
MRFIIIFALLATMSLSSFAKTIENRKTDSRHFPRIDQIDSRIHEQNRQIVFAQTSGKISKIEETQYKKELYQIIQQEEKMRKRNHNHLTLSAQNLLNHQLDIINHSLLTQLEGNPITYAENQHDN